MIYLFIYTEHRPSDLGVMIWMSLINIIETQIETWIMSFNYKNT